MSKTTRGAEPPKDTTVTISSRGILIAVGAVIVVGAAYLFGRGQAGTSPSAAQAPAQQPAAGAPVPQPVMPQAAPLGYSVPAGNATAPPVAAVSGGPRLATDFTKLDFGSKGYGEPVAAQFTLTNVGDAPLVIEDAVRVDTIAGC